MTSQSDREAKLVYINISYNIIYYALSFLYALSISVKKGTLHLHEFKVLLFTLQEQ